MAASQDAEAIDRAYDVLGDHTRRCILRYLSARPERRVSVDALCQAIARERLGRDGSPRNVDRLASALHHVHLPKLAAADLIDYDRSARTVQYQADPFVEQLLEAIPGGSQ